jgi:hypothetical protein
MKATYIKTNTLLLILIVTFSFLFSSCEKDGDEPAVPRTTEDYIAVFTKLIASERALLDTCIVGYNKNDFKQGSSTNFVPYKTAYKLVLDTASARLNKSGITIAKIIELDKTLSTPGKNFWGSLFTSDRRPLNDAIVKSEALNTATVSGTGAGQSLADPKATFTAAITKAKTTRDATVTIDRQVTDAIVLLADAEKVFTAAIIPNTIDEYQSRSKSFVASEKTIVNGSPVGYNKDEYNISTQTAYLTVLNAADPVVNKAGVTYAEISAALATLATPGKNFYASKFICDRRPLNDSIVVAQTLNTATLVGTTSGKVSQAAKTSFTTAITTASTARDKATTTEGQVKAAVYALGLARKSFKSAIIK